MASSDTAFDVVVVGGGMAGLSAALSAAQHGARTLVMEKADQAGGNASIAAGMFLGSDDFAGLHNYIPDGDPALQRAFCADFLDSLSWLEQQGMALGPIIDFGDFRKLRPMTFGRPGDRLPFMQAMEIRAKRSGTIIRTNTRVNDLRLTSSGVSVDAIDPQGQNTVTAKAVILATGGFAANRLLLERHLGPEAQFLKIRSLPGPSGDGLMLSQRLGASIGGDITAFYGHTMADCPLEPMDWQPLTPYFARLGVLVNRAGRRFVDESGSLLEELNAQAGFRQPGGKYWLLFDERIRLGEPSSNGSDKVLPAVDWLEHARKAGAPLFETPTLDALVGELRKDGVDAAALASEIDDYNSACDQNQSGSLQPPKRSGAWPLEVAPFYALRCVAGITATCGGVAVDDWGRVLDNTQHPLPGVFAAGTEAGGAFGKTYGGFLSWAVVSGRRAGAAAATRENEL